jgi:alpha-N-arabinofuranosidase
MDTNITRAAALCQAYSTYGHRVGVFMDEWGTWFREAVVGNGLFQQSTLQDALFTARSFHMFHRHAEWLEMTNMAQTINVLQALILTDGPDMLVTPTYHVYDLFKPHRDGRRLPTTQNLPKIKLPGGTEEDAVTVSASLSEDGSQLCLSLVNIDLTNACDLTISISGLNQWQPIKGNILSSTGVRDHNTFGAPQAVSPKYWMPEVIGDSCSTSLPPAAIGVLQFSC